MTRWMAVAALLSTGCYDARGDEPDPGCTDDGASACAVLGEWVFPTEPCGMDHSVAIGLCPSGHAAVETAPRALGGEGTHLSGTWTRVVSPELVSVQLDDSEVRLEYQGEDDALLLRDPAGCTSATGYRIGDARLDLGGGWSADWAEGLCDR